MHGYCYGALFGGVRLAAGSLLAGIHHSFLVGWGGGGLYFILVHSLSIMLLFDPVWIGF